MWRPMQVKFTTDPTESKRFGNLGLVFDCLDCLIYVHPAALPVVILLNRLQSGTAIVTRLVLRAHPPLNESIPQPKSRLVRIMFIKLRVMFSSRY